MIGFEWIKIGAVLQGKVETMVGVFVLAALAIFVYMGFEIGVFRFDRARYTEYILYFDDITGLTRKAEVKISGVKVGWVEEIKLIPDHEIKAKARVMVLKDYELYSDAHAIVRQDGLLGPKYIEIVPGDPLLQRLTAGEPLSKPGVEPVDIDELLQQFKEIAGNVKEVTASFRDVLGGPEGKEQLQSVFDNLENTAEKFSTFSNVLESAFVRNEDNIDALLAVGTNIRTISDKLEREVFPSFQESIEKISDVFDRDFDRIATKLESTAEALEEAAVQARDGLRNISSVAEKIDEGKGLIGKLVNEDETYRDLKVAVAGFKNYVTKIDRMEIVFDTHFESMHRPAENYEFEDSKGYFDVRIHPNEDHFYVLQVVTSEKGFINRKETERIFLNKNTNQTVDPSKVPVNGRLRFEPEDFFRKQKLKFKRNTLKVGLQFGKIFKDIALRLGLFEGSAGLGLDIDIPFKTEKFRWVTSFEMFDFSGWNRKDDRRPHLKWLNKMFIMHNIYFIFGADDFASKRNANAFFGAGIRFGDDDVKYLLNSISGAGNLV